MEATFKAMKKGAIALYWRLGNPQRGFTVLELLVVLGIMSLILTYALNMWSGAKRRAQEAAALSYVKGWPTAVEAFYINFNRYPKNLGELVSNRLLGQMDSGKVPYTFTLAQKVASAPALQMFASSQQDSWWTPVMAWVSVSPAWATHEGGDPDKGHGNEPGGPGGCDPGNPGQGGLCGGGGGTGWEGWANPLSSKGKHFYVDDTGVIRYTFDATAGSSSAPIGT